MGAALFTINWLDVMEPMDTQEVWEVIKTVFQDITDKYVLITTEVYVTGFEKTRLPRTITNIYKY